MRLLNKYNFLLILLKDTINDDTMQRSRKRQVENYDGIRYNCVIYVQSAYGLTGKL